MGRFHVLCEVKRDYMHYYIPEVIDIHTANELDVSGGMPGSMQAADGPSLEKWVYTGGTSEEYDPIPPLYPRPPEPTRTWNPEKSY